MFRPLVRFGQSPGRKLAAKGLAEPDAAGLVQLDEAVVALQGIPGVDREPVVRPLGLRPDGERLPERRAGLLEAAEFAGGRGQDVQGARHVGMGIPGELALDGRQAPRHRDRRFGTDLESPAATPPRPGCRALSSRRSRLCESAAGSRTACSTRGGPARPGPGKTHPATNIAERKVGPSGRRIRDQDGMPFIIGDSSRGCRPLSARIETRLDGPRNWGPGNWGRVRAEVAPFYPPGAGVRPGPGG